MTIPDMTRSESQAGELMREAVRLQSQGDHRRALAIYERILGNFPGHPDVLHNCGLARFQLGDIAAAEGDLLRALTARPDFARARANLVKLWIRMDRPGTLAEIVADAVWLSALDYDASIGLSRHFMAREEFAVALGPARRAVELDAAVAPGNHCLGLCLLRTHDAEQAEACLRRALESEPANPELMADLARCLLTMHMRRKIARYRHEAFTLLVSARAAAPGSARIRHELGILHEEDGEFEAAASEYGAALDINPDHLPSVASLASISRADPPAALLERLQSLLTRELPYPASEQARGYQALGKCLDRLQDPERAFSCFSKANALSKPQAPYDRRRREDYVTNLMAAYGGDAPAAHAAPGSGAARPVFIVGMPRSGTTLLEHMLSSHPDIEGAGELPWFINLERRGAALHDETGQRCREWASRRSAGYLASLRREFDRILDGINPDAAHVIDKMPFNFSQVGMILTLYPDAVILHTLRDPRDVALSCYIESFAPEHRWSFDLSDIAHYLGQYQRLMDHWIRLFPHRILPVRYEDVVAGPESITRRILERLALPWHDGCRNYLDQFRSIRTPSTWQVRQPLYRTSVGRWRSYDRHLAPVFGSRA